MLENNNQKVDGDRKRVQKTKEELQGFPTVPVPLENSHGTQRTVNLKFETWISKGFTWIGTQQTHIPVHVVECLVSLVSLASLAKQ